MPEKWEQIDGMSTGLKNELNRIANGCPEDVRADLVAYLNSLQEKGCKLTATQETQTGFYDHGLGAIKLNTTASVLVQANTLIYEGFNWLKRGGYVTAFANKTKRDFKQAATQIADIECNVTLDFADLLNRIPEQFRDDSSKRVLNQRNAYPQEGFRTHFMEDPHDSTAPDYKKLPTPNMYYYENIAGAGGNQIQKFLSTVIKDRNQITESQKSSFGLIINELARYWPAAGTGHDYGKERVRRFQHMVDRLEHTYGKTFNNVSISAATKTHVGYQKRDWGADPLYARVKKQGDANPFSKWE